MHSDSPLVSIVIPTYNQEAFIYETVQSVLQQSYEHLEVIISDDASTDKTVSIVKKLAENDKRIKLLLSNENQGIPANFNRAFDAVSGKYVCFLGGDDLMYHDKVQKQLSFLENNSEYGLVQSDMDLYDLEQQKVVERLSDHGEIPTDPLDWALSVDWNFDKKYSGVIPSSCMALSSYYCSARYSDDFYLKHELLFTIESHVNFPHLKWGVIDETLGRYVFHSSNFSQSGKSQKSILEESFKLAKIAFNKFPSLRKRVENFEFFVAYKNLLFKNYSNSAEKEKLAVVFRKHANGMQQLAFGLAKFLVRIKLFGLFRILNRIFGIFKLRA